MVGHAATIAAGEFVQLSGSWVNDRTHGLQFRAGFLKASPPTTLEGIERYLGSGMIRGIGPIYARRLVRAFGETVFERIEQQPERLREVTGIGPKRAARIVAGWAEQKVIREIMLFLHANGVGTSRAVRIYKTYGSDAVQVISENPYRLARDIRGIGFRTADQIAAKLGIEKTAMVRVRAGISYALAEAMEEGHCGLPVEELTALAGKLIEVPAALIETALELELEAGEVVADSWVAGAASSWRACTGRSRRSPNGCARSPLARHRGRRSSRTGRSPGSSGRPGSPSRESQQGAVRLALCSKVLVITGGPGVGKTTLVNAILKILAARAGRRGAVCAHGAGRQALVREHRARRRRPCTGCWKPTRAAAAFAGRPERPLACDLLVIDEASMVDVPLMRALLRALPDRCGTAGGRRRRPAALGWSRPGAGRPHRLGRRAGGPADRGVPAGGREPGHRQRAPHQPGPDAGSRAGEAASRISTSSRRPMPRRALAKADRRGARSHPASVRPRSGPRRPGALPDEPRRARRPGAERRAAAGAQPARRGAGRAVRLDFRSRATRSCRW